MEKAIGALWLKESKKGVKYMSGVIEIGDAKHEVVVFKNDKGDNDRRPDYRIYPSAPRDGQQVEGQTESPRGFSDDIPF